MQLVIFFFFLNVDLLFKGMDLHLPFLRSLGYFSSLWSQGFLGLKISPFPIKFLSLPHHQQVILYQKQLSPGQECPFLTLSIQLPVFVLCTNTSAILYLFDSMLNGEKLTVDFEKHPLSLLTLAPRDPVCQTITAKYPNWSLCTIHLQETSFAKDRAWWG